MINVNGTFELADVKAANALHARAGRLATWLGYLIEGGLVLILLVAIVLAFLGSAPWWYVLYPAFILGFMVLFRFYIRPSQIARSYNQHKELSSPFEMELTEAGYSIKNSYGSSTMPWKDFAKWKEDQQMILLYRTDAMFNMIPKRLLPEEGQVQFILEQLRRNNVKEASQVRNPMRIILWTILVILLLLVVVINFYISFQSAH
jgi:uncharacterized membrane protein